MTRKQLLILWIITLIAGALVYAFSQGQQSSLNQDTHYSTGDEPLKSLSDTEVTGLKINDSKNAVNLALQENQWSLTEKNNFPANTQTLSSVFDNLIKVKITQAFPAEETHWERFGLNPASEDEDLKPISIAIIGKDGGAIDTLYLGNERKSGDPNSARAGGRFARLASDPKAVYLLNDSLTAISPNITAWLSQDFLKLDAPLSISMKTLSAEDPFKPWTLTRNTASDDFSLTGKSPDQEDNTDNSNPLKNLLASATFNDVHTPEQAEEIKAKTNPRQLSITTEAGFHYVIKIHEKQMEKSAENSNYLISFTLNADLKAPPKLADDATEEQKKSHEQELKAYKENEARLDNEKKLEPYIFEVPNYVFSNVMKELKDFHKDPTPPANLLRPEETPDAPKRKYQAVSPPIEVPAQPRK